jgi:hypothetical protein
MGKFIPTRDADTGQFTPFFHEWIELNFGAPRGVVSDRDTGITSKFWAEVCIYSLIKRRMRAFRPQTDGQTEILNRILENYLRAYTSLEQMNWAKLLPTAELAYSNNIADNVTKGEAPAARDLVERLHELRERLRDFRLCTGRELRFTTFLPYSSGLCKAAPSSHSNLKEQRFYDTIEP